MARGTGLADETTSLEPLSLEQHVERLGARDWRVGLATHAVLVEAGEAGLQAVIQGLFRIRQQYRPRARSTARSIRFVGYPFPEAVPPSTRRSTGLSNSVARQSIYTTSYASPPRRNASRRRPISRKPARV